MVCIGMACFFYKRYFSRIVNNNRFRCCIFDFQQFYLGSLYTGHFASLLSAVINIMNYKLQAKKNLQVFNLNAFLIKPKNYIEEFLMN